MLTDAGAVFTWGDNRYGQLGRHAVMLEEGKQAFPVLALHGDEISQVAAGKHHCLALSASGLVWSWGRNKAGQLGRGDKRDAMLPAYVMHAPPDGRKASSCLGRGPPPGVGGGPAVRPDKTAEQLRASWRISSIGASADSSTAVAFNSCVFQWGGINERRNERLEEERLNKPPGATSGATHTPPGFPRCVMEPGRLRPIRDTQAHISVSQLGRWALVSKGRPGQRDEMAHRVAVVENMRLEIARSRETLWRLDAAHKKAAEERLARSGGSGDGQSLAHFHDTVAQLTQEIESSEREIETLKMKKAKVEQVEKLVRDQLQSLTKTSADIDSDKKRYMEAREKTDQGDQKLFYSEKVKECEQLLIASSASRASLLEQRSDMDRERHQVSEELYKTIADKKKLEARRQVVQDLFKATSNDHTASDPMVKFLQDQADSIRNHFSDRVVEHTYFAAAKQSFEQDAAFLDVVEDRLTEWFNSQPPEWRDHAAIIIDILQDIVDLRRDWSSLLEDRWRKQDLDMSVFLDRGRPPEVSQPTAGALALR
jgi:hypothetical protein